MEYKKLCPYIQEQRDYHQCSITAKPCIGSNYANYPQYLKLEKICDCPGSKMPAGLAEQVRDLCREHCKRE